MGKLLREKREKGKGKKNEAQLCARHHHQHTLARSATTQPITTAMTRPQRCHARCHGDSRAHATVGLRREGNQAGGWGECDLGIQAGSKPILIFESTANQISRNIIISQSKSNKITAEYHSIFRHRKKAIQIPEISKAEFDGGK